MKKQLFRWLPAITLTLLALVFAGCGGSSDAKAPAKPTAVAATAGDAEAAVTWTASADATSYNVYYGTTAGVTTASGTKVAGATSGQAITGLANGTTYYFVVTAVGAHGESVVSDEVLATPLPPLPGKVQGLRVSGDNGQVVMAWSPVTGATSYNVYYSTTSGFTTSTGTKVELTAEQAAAGLTTPGLTVSGLANGTTYYFLVTAANVAGESTTPSSQSSAKPSASAQAPAKPTGVSVASGAGSVTVSWDWVPLASSYNVYYMLDSGTPTTSAVIANSQKVSSAVSPVTISGLTPGASYWVTVTATGSGLESGGQNNPKQGIPQ